MGAKCPKPSALSSRIGCGDSGPVVGPISCARSAPLNRDRASADTSAIKPGSIPAGLDGNQLSAYLEGYAAAEAWTNAGAAFEICSLASELLVSFTRGFEAARADMAENHQAS